MEAHSETTVQLPQRLKKQAKANLLKLGPKRLAQSSQEEVLIAIARRALIDYYEATGDESVDGDADDTWEEDSSSSRSDDSSTESESE